MLVSAVRECVDHAAAPALALDVVFHGSVIRRAEADPSFKASIITLAVDWARQESGLPLPRLWKPIKAAYKGGQGPAKDRPVPFPLRRALAQVSARVLRLW